MPASETSSSPTRRFAVEVVQRLREAGFVAYWAGGCVRDLLLGKTPKDYDVATDARPETVQSLFGKRHTRAVGAAFGVILVHGPRDAGDIEIATFRAEGPYLDGRRPEHVVFCTPAEDAQRRDFTINGMFFDPLTEEVLDYVGGQADLRNRCLRAIGDPHARFEEDKLRMLRAIRFTATLDFEIDPQTAAAIKAMASQIRVVSAERITQEWKRMLTHEHRVLALELARQLHVLPPILPELNTLLESAEDADFRGWNHLLTGLRKLREPSFELSFAALLSGLELTTPIVHQICRRWKLSNEETERIAWLLGHRKSLHEVEQFPLSRLKRLLVQPGIYELFDLLTAMRADHPEVLEEVHFAREYLARTPAEELNPPLLITGDDLRVMGVEPGPRFKFWLDELRDAQLEGRLQTREQALAHARQLIGPQTG